MRIYNTELFYPMLAMFLRTVVVMLQNLQVRVDAFKRGELTNSHFELLKGAEPPEAVQKIGNHFGNLTEMPPRFFLFAASNIVLLIMWVRLAVVL